VAFSGWSFTGRWRGYQTQCLAAFEADRDAGRHQTLIVAPPGSGKTIVGLEIVRRLGVPAVVLCPSRTIQRQWSEKQALFGEVDADLHALTYQSLCQTSDPEGMLREAAAGVWARERAGITGQRVEDVVLEASVWEGAAAARRERDVARLVSAMKRRVAAGKLPDLPAGELLSASARARAGALRDAGVRVVVLDECHHLLSLWGALLKAVLDELSPRHVLGLTATNPRDVTAEQAALYAALLDSVDFSVPTPAVVREGFLAPYQELVQLCTPLASEQEWLAERHARFDLALSELSLVPAGVEHLGLDVWLTSRLSERAGAGGGTLSWSELTRRQPRLADAGLRWMHACGVKPPADAPHGEQHRAALTIDDWVVLLEDYALRCLRADASAEASRRLDALQVALGDLGFAVTRQGIRRVGGEVDRVLLSSAAKPLAMCDVLACEYEARGRRLRAVVMCDSERPPRQPADSPLTLTGGGRGLLASAGADERLVGARPALVTGETFAVLPADADWWAERFCALAGAAPAGASSASARAAFAAGLRRDAEAGADPAKLANNWDVVCVAPALGRGHADYRRFVRRHAHLHAPCEDGTIETGPSHVHPELSPYGPPAAERFVTINIEQQVRAEDRDAARARWSIGQPYRGVDLDVLVVRHPRRISAGEARTLLSTVAPPRWRWLAGRRAYPEQLPLEWAAGAVCDAYVALGELPASVAAAMQFTVRPEGWVRVSLPDADVQLSRNVSGALDELFGGGGLPRYVVSRRVVASVVPFFGRHTAWHAVPLDLARRKERAAAFHVAWRRWMGKGELVYCHGGDPRGRELAVRASSVPALETQRRRIWR
jgi:hypothetical protein